MKHKLLETAKGLAKGGDKILTFSLLHICKLLVLAESPKEYLKY